MNSIGQNVFELVSGNENVDRQTDVGYINLIGGLVTRLKISPDEWVALGFKFYILRIQYRSSTVLMKEKGEIHKCM